ncbi:MAG TPA: alkaline shock response membrane anchor protein AmaP [Firmicutes bacterium]|nr:alkaline shock response membrane anchor protein AmaP [Bacillota bacterium]
MTILDRVFLALSAAVLFLFAALLAVTIAGNPAVINWLQSPNLALDASIPALILVLLGVYLVILAVRYERKRYIVYARDLGAVRVSTDCIEGLIMESAREMAGIKDAAVRIVDVEHPKVRLDIQILPDYNIPQLTEELQEKVKQYVEDTVGVAIQEVEIVVAAIARREETIIDLLP